MSGDKGHMVLIHGAFTGGWAMACWAEAMTAAGWTCHTPNLLHHDTPAHGRPHPDLGRTSLVDYADDLARLIRTLPDKPVIVGHSMGGLIAQMLAGRGLARAAVLLAPSPPWGVIPSTDFEILSAVGMVATLGVFWDGPIHPVYRVAADHTLNRLPREERRQIFSRFVPESGRAVFEIMHSTWDMRRASRVEPWTVKCPVLALAGSADKVNSARTVKRIADRYRDTEGKTAFRLYDGFSHWMVSEPGWEEMAADASAWLDRVLP
ncbi:alpha/beta hydrolase [Zavarzinia aquatilis]|uniref:Alpha/beta hydrolase n=1 Tax=Zavarzinia aquatilis TaxID=2211142 RepID=A0A317EFJ4_9PROT|nr:alpha/beta fold hydrolase [Zavarzinia aquatilis]PWR24163.1 alpha/beta hydrolase [Zavarzinia aquatilis]